MSVSYSLTPSYSCSVNRNATKGETPSQKIDSRISEYADWRGEQLGRMRNLILASHADIFEEWKWNVPVWSCHGIICTGEVYKSVVKLTFAKGASLPDPKGLFNSSLDGKVRRAIDIREGATINARSFTALIKAAVKHNLG